VTKRVSGGGGGGGGGGIQNEKQEPHTKMWGKTKTCHGVVTKQLEAMKRIA